MTPCSVDLRDRTMCMHLAVATLLSGFHWNLARAQELRFELSGERRAEEFGRPVSALGDIDGDGRIDLLVRRISVNPDGSYEKDHAVMYSGRDGSRIWDVAPDDAPYSSFGISGAVIPDQDADGVEDVAIGATGWGLGDKYQAGAVYVYSLGTRTALRLLEGEEEQSLFGAPLLSGFDADRDGIEDILVGATAYENGGHFVGKIYIYSGRDLTLLAEILGENDDGRFGYSVDLVGDVNRDGIDDVIVSAPYLSAGGDPRAGRVYVLSTKDWTTIQTFSGEKIDTYLGLQVAGVGDVDQDGHDDFAMFDAQYFGGFVAGVRVHSGRDGSILYVVKGTGAAQQGFGTSVRSHHDFNGDGWADIIAGENGADTEFGEDSGRVFVFSGRDGSNLYWIDGEEKNDGAGFYMAMLGDGDGDGFADIATVQNAGRHNASTVRVYTGNDLFLHADPPFVDVGDTLALNTQGGPPGALALLALVAIDGVDSFLPLEWDLLDATGTWRFSTSIPPGLSGHDFTFQSFAEKRPGIGGAVDSLETTVPVN